MAALISRLLKAFSCGIFEDTVVTFALLFLLLAGCRLSVILVTILPLVNRDYCAITGLLCSYFDLAISVASLMICRSVV